jgi:hypothetical protein
MECNIEEIGGQIVESSNRKRWKGMAKLASGFSIKIELGLDRTQYVPLMQQGYIQEGLCLSTLRL